MRVWLVAFGRFVRRVLRLVWLPAGGISTLLGFGVVVLIAWLLGQRWGLVSLVGGVALLFLVAGVRMEHDALDAEQVRLRFEPVQFPIENVSVLLCVRIHNDGPAGDFSATVIRGVTGVPERLRSPEYGPFEVRWENRNEAVCRIAHDAEHRIDLASYLPRGGLLMFLGPESSYGDLTTSAAFVPERDVCFVLEVRDLERDRYRREVFVITFDAEKQWPSLRSDPGKTALR